MTTLKDSLVNLVDSYIRTKSIDQAYDQIERIIGGIHQGTMIDKDHGIAWIISREDLESVAKWNGKQLVGDEDTLLSIVSDAFDTISDNWADALDTLLDENDLYIEEAEEDEDDREQSFLGKVV